MFSARFDKQDVDDQLSEEIELHDRLGITQNFTQNNIASFIVRFQLEHQIINQEMTEKDGDLIKMIQ